MTFVLLDRVLEQSSTTGTGDFVLGGAIFGHRTFAAAPMADGDQTLVAITFGADWEVVLGTYKSSTNAIVRTSVLASSNGGAPVNFGAGTKHIKMGLPAAVMKGAIDGASGTARPVWLPPNGTWTDTNVDPPLRRAYRQKTFTVTIASPAVVSSTGHGLMPGQALVFTTTGALPTGLTAGTTYYVISAGFDPNTFRVSATKNGSAVNTSGSQSGTHTFHADLPIGRVVAGGLSGMVGETKEWNADTPLPACGTYLWEDGSNVSRNTYADYYAICGVTHGSGDGSTTVGIPDSRGRVAANQDGSANRLVTGLTGGVDGDTVGAAGGEDRHVQTSAELVQHTHVQNPHQHTIDIRTALNTTSGGGQADGWHGVNASGLTASATPTNQNTGSSAAANNVQPTIVKKKIIKVLW